jgi:NAD(P)-dependent dehydrogenase (short-subunit alcohol dehydrogenase family)
MSGSVQSKIALVTGAGGGIGQAIARALAAAGADVAIHDREMPPALAAEAAEIEHFGRRAVAVAGDVRDENGVAAFVAQAIDALGRIDILVNNAGVMTEIPLLHMTLEDWRQTLEINLTVLPLPARGRQAQGGQEDWLDRQRGRATCLPRRRRARSLQRRKGRRSRIDQSRGEGTGRLRYPRQCYRSRPDRDEDDRTLQNAGPD